MSKFKSKALNSFDFAQACLKCGFGLTTVIMTKGTPSVLNATKGIQKQLTPNHPAHSTVAFANYEIYWEATLTTPAHLWSCFCGQLGQRRFSRTKWAMDSMCSLATAKAYMEHESLEVTLEAVEIREMFNKCNKKNNEVWQISDSLPYPMLLSTDSAILTQFFPAPTNLSLVEWLRRNFWPWTAHSCKRQPE